MRFSFSVTANCVLVLSSAILTKRIEEAAAQITRLQTQIRELTGCYLFTRALSTARAHVVRHGAEANKAEKEDLTEKLNGANQKLTKAVQMIKEEKSGAQDKADQADAGAHRGRANAQDAADHAQTEERANRIGRQLMPQACSARCSLLTRFLFPARSRSCAAQVDDSEDVRVFAFARAHFVIATQNRGS